MTEIKPLNDVWIVVRPDGTAIISTASESENGSKNKFLHGQACFWNRFEKQGYTCLNVNITINSKEDENLQMQQ